MKICGDEMSLCKQVEDCLCWYSSEHYRDSIDTFIDDPSQ